VKEGLLTKITSRFIKECMFFLFNDVLIYTYPMLGKWNGFSSSFVPSCFSLFSSSFFPCFSPIFSVPHLTFSRSSGYFQYKGSIVLGPSWLRDLQDTPQVKNSFQIVCKNKTYTVFATTPEIKKEWMTALQEQIDILVELQPQLLSKSHPLSLLSLLLLLLLFLLLSIRFVLLLFPHTFFPSKINVHK
jgi:hypothetical protein